MANEHVVTDPNPPFLAAQGRLQIHQVPVWQDNLVWLIVDPSTSHAFAVDGPEAGPVLAYCRKNELQLQGILNTHTHPDHIGINRDLARRGLLERMRVVGARKRAADVPGVTELVDDGDVVAIGSVVGKVMLTEGHIDGHISYLFEDVLFCGDTLFAGGCGYLFDGPPSKMHSSLTRLAALPEETKVCCAHEYTEDNLKFAAWIEPENSALQARIERVRAIRAQGKCTVPSSMGMECQTNPFLRGHSPSLQKELQRRLPHLDLHDPVAVFGATRALKDQKLYKANG